MAAPAAVVAVVVSPPLAGERHIVATTRLLPRPVVKYEWRLEGVTKDLFTAAAAGHKLESPPFSAHGFEWTLQLYPNGVTEAGRGFVGVILHLHTKDVTATITGSLGAGLAADTVLPDGAVFSTCNPCPEGAVAGRGFRSYSHDSLLRSFDKLLPGGVLTVRCTLRTGDAAVHDPVNPIHLPAPNLSAGLSALLESGEDADVTLVCGDERLAAHRLVLRMRSPVFAAQLDDVGPLQADASAVPVPPEITPQTLRRLLEFIYTDELQPASPEEATHLLNAADHYDVPRLFAICERALCAVLSVDNAAETLTLADQHSAAGLKGAALRFVAANVVAVMATPGWVHLQSSRPALITEALHTLATGAPPVALARAAAADAGGDAGAAGAGGEGDGAQRPRKRAR
jgi:speckle-type POZ protein